MSKPRGTKGVRKILIIDDEVDLVALFELHLRRAGYDTRAAYDGRAGLLARADYAPDLVLLDRTLTDMDGRDVFRRIRKVSRVPILFVTGRRDGGPNDLVKPFSMQALVTRVEALLGTRARRQVC